MNQGENGQPAASGERPEEEAPELKPEIQAIIGQHLKAHYDDLIQAPMPDKFLLLLAQLEAKESGSGDGR